MLDLNMQHTKYRRYSQHGEEGIVDAFIGCVYSESERSSLLACEFGAHDGSNSNLLKIVEDGSSFGVFIECDKSRFDIFSESYSHLANSKVINGKVGWEKDNDLAAIFRLHGLAIDNLKILSIDIDGDDAHILENMSYSIDLVLIEYNPTFGFDTEFCNPKGSSIGSSPKTLAKIASTKSLFLAAVTETNLIFVNKKFEGLIRKYDLREIEPCASATRYAMGYDGTLVVVDGKGTDLTNEIIGVGWSKSFFLQPTPRVIRRFDEFGKTRLVYSLFVLLVTRPFAVFALCRKIVKYKTKKQSV